MVTPPLLLRYRIIATIVTLVAVVMGVVLWQTLEHSLSDHRKQERELQDVVVTVLTEVARKGFHSGDFTDLQSYLHLVTSDPHVAQIAVTGPDGKIIASTLPARRGAPLGDLHDSKFHDWTLHPIPLPDGSSGTIAVQHDNSHSERAFHDARNFAMVIGVVSIFIVAFIGVYISGLLTNRLSVLSAVVQEFAAGNLQVRVPDGGNDELTELGRTFNDMADAIHRNFRRLREAEEKNERNFQVQRIIAAALHTAQEAIPFNHRLERILDLVLSLPWLADEGTGGAIYVLNRRTNTLELRAQRGLRSPAPARALDTPIDPSSDLKGLGATLAPDTIGKHGNHTTVPVLSGDKILGVLVLQRDPSYRHQDQEDAILGAIARTIGTIIERHTAAERIRTLSRAMEQSPASIIITDTEGNIEYVNPKFTEATGYTLDEVRGTNPRILRSGETSCDVYQQLWSTITRGMEWCGEFHNRKKNGELFWEYASISGIKGEDGRISNFIAVKEDITERKEAEAQNVYLAYTDQLTGLPNRARLLDVLTRALARRAQDGQGLALAIVNPDRFREINDTLGHENGDILLKQVAKRIAETVNTIADEGRHGDETLVARLGGDEFAVLLGRLGDREAAEQVGRRLVAAMEMPFFVDELLIEISPSIGLCFHPDDGADVETLMRRADVAMHAAKSTSTPFVVYSPEIDNYSPRRLALIGELRRAISRNALRLHYQPKVDLITMETVAVEALLRWRHDAYGHVRPDEFIPLAERSGLIRPLTQWILNAALQDNRTWRERGVFLDVAVNLSALNLMDLHLPDIVRDLLEAWEVPASALILEITETAVMLDPDSSLNVLKRLAAMGVRLSIDDYGTGYSSLAYLKKLPVEELKIDRSFVSQMTTAENDATIVRSTVGLAHNLGLTVIAEGVEDERTLNLLRDLGCDQAQGYFIARPLPDDQLLAWLVESRWFKRSNVAQLPTVPKKA